MQAMASIRIWDMATTAPVACLFSAASGHRSISTGKERDTESGNDYSNARYYGSSMGRFLSPDPVFINADRVLDPQGLNLYAYARNNPLTITDPTGLDFYQTCSTASSTCQSVQNGSKSVLVQGTTDDKGAFTANRIANDENGNLVDTAHGNAAVTGNFDQSGVHLNGSQGQFIQGSNETTLNGSGVFAGVTGNFFDACGGSCQAHGTLTESDPGSGALGHAEGLLHQQSKFASSIDALSGAHPWGTTQWKDSNGYVHMIQIPGAAMDMHFEGHPTGEGLMQFILHSVDTVKDLFSGRAGAEGPITQREGSLPQ
jgi:RHS repeat-associated protein